MPTYRAGFAHPLEDLRDEFDRFWNTLTAAPPLHGWSTRPAGPAFPAVNVAESDDAVTVEAELPGLAAGDVEISMVDDELVLSGARPEAAEAAGAAAGNGNGERRSAVTWHRRERGSGRFERRIPLPVAVDAGRVEARLVDGVLTVTCPKAPEAKPRKVEVKSA
jgi:HSP20 family protein